MTYYEYTGQAQIIDVTDVDFTVAIPKGASREEQQLLMKAAAEGAARAGKGSWSRRTDIHNFSRGVDLTPPAAAE